MQDLVLIPKQEYCPIPRLCDAPPRRILGRAETTARSESFVDLKDDRRSTSCCTGGSCSMLYWRYVPIPTARLLDRRLMVCQNTVSQRLAIIQTGFFP